MSKRRTPLEADEQKTLAAILDARRLLWTHVPNEAKRSWALVASLKAQGLKPGVPDVLIFDPPPNEPGAVGTAIELKRRDGTEADLTDAQDRWLKALALKGWACFVCYGAADASRRIAELGY